MVNSTALNALGLSLCEKILARAKIVPRRGLEFLQLAQLLRDKGFLVSANRTLVFRYQLDATSPCIFVPTRDPNQLADVAHKHLAKVFPRTKG